MTHTQPGEPAGEPHTSRSLLRRGAAAAVALVFMLPMAGRAEANWEEGFRNPPAEYRPEVYWDWMGGLISKASITKDLEDGSKAVGLFNRGEMPATVSAKWSDLGIRGRKKVCDLWREKELGRFNGEFTARVGRHAGTLVQIR